MTAIAPVRRPRSVTLVVVLGLLLLAPHVERESTTAQAASKGAADTDGSAVYREITTDRPEGSGAIGSPILSADGTTAVFAESSPRSTSSKALNRVYVVGFDGTGLTELDAYAPMCPCESAVDLSADGATVVSTDGVQVRIAGIGGARPLIALAGRAIGSLRITADGDSLFFLVLHDTTTADGTTALTRGVWAIGADGSGLRPVVGVEAVAAALGVPVEDVRFSDGAQALDVSADGSRLVVVVDGGLVFAADSAGGTLRLLPTYFHPAANTYVSAENVGISADDTIVAYGGTAWSPDVQTIAPAFGAGIVPFAGGEARLLTTHGAGAQLSADGSLLLVGPELIDTRTGEGRDLFTLTPTRGLPQATMSGDGTRILFVLREEGRPEQLAALDLA